MVHTYTVGFFTDRYQRFRNHRIPSLTSWRFNSCPSSLRRSFALIRRLLYRLLWYVRHTYSSQTSR